MTSVNIQIPDRLYPNELPNVGDLVMVRITKISDDVIYCHILDYNRDGMLHFDEISKQKVRNIKKVIRVGNQECMEVIDIDKDKGYIDLSRKKSSDEDKEEYSKQYIAARRMHTFFYRWSVQCGEDFVTTILWKNYDQDNVYNGLISDNNWHDALPDNVCERVKDEFYKMFEKKAVKYELNVEMVCFSLDGINVIQKAIDKGLVYSTEDTPVQCIYTCKTGTFGSIFILSTVTKNDNGMAVLEKVADAIKEALHVDIKDGTSLPLCGTSRSD